MTAYGDERTRQINIRLSLAEKQALQALAAKCGLSVADTLRQLVRERFAEMESAA